MRAVCPRFRLQQRGLERWASFRLELHHRRSARKDLVASPHYSPLEHREQHSQAGQRSVGDGSPTLRLDAGDVAIMRRRARARFVPRPVPREFRGHPRRERATHARLHPRTSVCARIQYNTCWTPHSLSGIEGRLHYSPSESPISASTYSGQQAAQCHQARTSHTFPTSDFSKSRVRDTDASTSSPVGNMEAR